MKKYSFLVLAMVLVLSLFACKELVEVKNKFIQSGLYSGLGAYVDKIIYTAVDDPDEEDWIFFDKWNAFDGDHTIYYMSREDESFSGLKYVKRIGNQIAVSWDSENGILVLRNPFSYTYEEIGSRKWKKEVKEIIVILLKKPTSIMEAQAVLAQELGYVGQDV